MNLYLGTKGLQPLHKRAVVSHNLAHNSSNVTKLLLELSILPALYASSRLHYTFSVNVVAKLLNSQNKRASRDAANRLIQFARTFQASIKGRSQSTKLLCIFIFYGSY